MKGRGGTPGRSADARLLTNVLRRSLARMDLTARVAAALPERPPAAGGRRSRHRASVVAIGKAAPAMASGALARWSDRIDEVIVVTTDGTDAAAVSGDRRVRVLRASHPIPDARSLRAAEQCLELARTCAASASCLLVLVSGGASALACAPALGVHLSDKQGVTRAMLASGASIQDINLVRRHLSRIKGGGLARAAAPSPVLTIIASDVIAGRAADVGSGPSTGDPSSVREARMVLRRWAPAFAALPLSRTGPAPNARWQRIVASPEQLARAAAEELAALGFRARVLGPSQATVSRLAHDYVIRARRLAPKTALVRAAEPSLEVPKQAGRGGRSTHLAALVGQSLPVGAAFLAAATDGVDGASGTAGAVVDAQFLTRAGEANIAASLDRYDTGELHRRLASALPLEPTGHNLADLHVLIRR